MNLQIRERIKNLRRKRILDIAFYSISGGALFLQTLLFYDITTKGYFIATESNPYVLGVEIAYTALGDCLFAYKYFKFLKR